MIEASVGALWGVLHKEVNVGRARQVPRIAAVLAYFVLSPILGTATAVETIRKECLRVAR